MKKLISVFLLLLVVMIMPVFQAGCSGNAEPVASENNRWLELLNILPENETTLKAAYLVDLEYMLERMPDNEYTIGRRSSIFGNNIAAYSDDEWKATLGFTADEVKQTIEAGDYPRDIYLGVRGSFDRDDIDDAAHNGPGNEDVEVITQGDYEYYSWGEDYNINISKRSNVRHLGRGHRLALVDDFVVWMLWTEGTTDMIDAYAGTVPSLAKNEDYLLLAGALEEMDTVTAFFSAESYSLAHYYEVWPREKLDEEIDPRFRDNLFAALDYEYPLKEYRALATGAGKDETGYYLAIVLVNEDEATAQENAELLEKRINDLKIVWKEGTAWNELIDSMEIKANGRVTTARLYGKVAGYWDFFEIRGIMPFEPLLIHE